jgi:hypothetical protein
MTKIKKKKRGSPELPKITLSHFLRMSKEGSGAAEVLSICCPYNKSPAYVYQG